MPEGWLLCDGSAVSRTKYADLFAKIGTTYGSGNGSSTFNLPNLTDRFIQGSAMAGIAKSAGLPNIEGTLISRATNYNGSNVISSATGAFAVGGKDSAVQDPVTQYSGQIQRNITEFSAARSNSIYGNSSTVQPPALTMKFAIYSGAISKKLWLRTT